MAIDVSTPGTPGWWLDQLSAKLTHRRGKIGLLRRYMDGDPPLPEGAEGVREAYRTFQKKSRTAFGELVVEAVSERMVVTDWIAPDKNAAQMMRRVWSANSLDVFSSDVHDDMLGVADGYAIVGDPDDDGVPVVTREDPANVVTAHDPVRPQVVIAALKLYRDDVAGKDVAHVYLPGEVFVYRGEASLGSTVMASAWEFQEDESGPLEWTDDVPVVRFRNRRGLGEFEPHTDILDRINFMILQRLVTAAMQAYRQRATKGDLPDQDEDGKDIDYAEIFKPGPGALWRLPDGVELWESQVTDLTPMLSAVKDDIRDLAAVTRTPMSMLLPDGANQSAEGASFAREGLVFKSGDRIRRATYGWRRVQHLALQSAKIAADAMAITPVWAPPERFSLAERFDAAVKAGPAGVPWRTVMTDVLQFTPEQVDRMEAERAADMMLASALQPPQV